MNVKFCWAINVSVNLMSVTPAELPLAGLKMYSESHSFIPAGNENTGSLNSLSLQTSSFDNIKNYRACTSLLPSSSFSRGKPKQRSMVWIFPVPTCKRRQLLNTAGYLQLSPLKQKDNDTVKRMDTFLKQQLVWYLEINPRSSKPLKLWK